MGTPLKVKVITPHSGLSAFRDAAASIITGFRQAMELAWRLFLRDTRAEHRQSLLGYLWLVVPALATTLTWVFLNAQQVVDIDSGGVPYAIFVLSGTVLWTAFNSGVMAMLGIVGAARGVLAKVNFSHESLVYAACLRSAVDAGVASLLLIPALIAYGGSMQPSLALFPAAVLANLMLGWALGLAALPIAALYGDVSRAIQLALRFGFFLTPVIFMLPASEPARTLMTLNPVTPLLVSGRAWLTGSPGALPLEFVVVLTASVALFCAALISYKVVLPHLIERLSN